MAAEELDEMKLHSAGSSAEGDLKNSEMLNSKKFDLCMESDF